MEKNEQGLPPQSISLLRGCRTCFLGAQENSVYVRYGLRQDLGVATAGRMARQKALEGVYIGTQHDNTQAVSRTHPSILFVGYRRKISEDARL